MSFASIIGSISGFMYSKLLIVILLAGGLYFTVRTGFVQFRFLKESIKVVLEKPDQEVLDAEQAEADVEIEVEVDDQNDGFYHPGSVLPDIPQADPDPEEEEN